MGGCHTKRSDTKEKYIRGVDLEFVVQKWWVYHGALEALKASLLTFEAEGKDLQIVLWLEEELEEEL